jgi:hypothetical protein
LGSWVTGGNSNFDYRISKQFSKSKRLRNAKSNHTIRANLKFGCSDLFRASTFGFRAYIPAYMKVLQLVGLVSCGLLFVACETTQTAGQGNQEQKRLAALQEERAQPQPDESEQNLQNAQADLINRGTNPAVRY